MRHVDAPAQGLLVSLTQDINLNLGMEGHMQRRVYIMQERAHRAARL